MRSRLQLLSADLFFLLLLLFQPALMSFFFGRERGGEIVVNYFAFFDAWFRCFVLWFLLGFYFNVIYLMFLVFLMFLSAFLRKLIIILFTSFSRKSIILPTLPYLCITLFIKHHPIYHHPRVMNSNSVNSRLRTTSEIDHRPSLWFTYFIKEVRNMTFESISRSRKGALFRPKVNSLVSARRACSWSLAEWLSNPARPDW